MSMPTLQAVVCDLDGTLIDSESISIEEYGKVWSELSSVPPPQDLYSLFAGKTEEERVAIIHTETDSGLTLDALTRLCDERFDARWDRDGLPTLPGVERFLHMIREAGIRLGLVTSSYRAYVDRVIREKNWGSLFDTLIVREDAPHPKPAPDLYQEAMRRFILPASAIIAVEDSIPGVLSACGAGLRVLGVRHASHGATLPATSVVSSLESVQVQDLEHLLHC